MCVWTFRMVLFDPSMLVFQSCWCVCVSGSPTLSLQMCCGLTVVGSMWSSGTETLRQASIILSRSLARTQKWLNHLVYLYYRAVTCGRGQSRDKRHQNLDCMAQPSLLLPCLLLFFFIIRWNHGSKCFCHLCASKSKQELITHVSTHDTGLVLIIILVFVFSFICIYLINRVCVCVHVL